MRRRANVQTYVNIKKSLFVVDTKRPSEFAFAQQIVEGDPRPDRNAISKLLPPKTSVIQGLHELLYHVSRSQNRTCNYTYTTQVVDVLILLYCIVVLLLRFTCRPSKLPLRSTELPFCLLSCFLHPDHRLLELVRCLVRGDKNTLFTDGLRTINHFYQQGLLIG